MKPQIILTETGEELVVLSRREYDLLLAQSGDEEAEDRLTLETVERIRGDIATGRDHWVLRDDLGKHRKT